MYYLCFMLQKIVLNKVALQTITDLSLLDLSDNNIRTVDEDAFSNCAKLWWLSLTANQISEVHPNAFRGQLKEFSNIKVKKKQAKYKSSVKALAENLVPF